MIEVVNVSSKGQIVIPERVRKELGIRTGAKLVLLEREGAILLKKEEHIARQLEALEKKENKGWNMLAEKSLRKIWDNPHDEKTWKKYLLNKK